MTSPLPRSRSFLTALLLILAGNLVTAGLSRAQDLDTEITGISERLLFVVSGGYWEDAAVTAETAPAGESEPAGEEKPAEGAPATEARESAASPPAKRGYYRLVALRAEDNTSRVYLQQMRLAETGPEVEMTTDIEEISSQSLYVTNIVQEIGSAAGFSAFVYAKPDPKLPEPDTWTVFVDEFGELSVEKATN